MNYIDYISKWIKTQVENANAKGVVVGISGGIDSALVSVIAKKAFDKNVIGVIMPIGNMAEHYEHAVKHVNQFQIENKIIDLTQAFELMKKTTQVANKLAVANLKPRLRMATLYAIAQEHNYLVLGTDNADELLLGYFTKYGDGGVDLLPIAQLTKTEVRNYSKMLGVSQEIIDKKPTADLWEGQTDELEMGITYDEVDDYLNGKTISEKSKERIEYLNRISAHKRNPIPIPEHPRKL